MTHIDSIALLLVAAALVGFALPFVLVGGAELVRLRKGREEREGAYLSLVLALRSALVSAPAPAPALALSPALSPAPALAPALALASAPSAESHSFSVVSSSSPLPMSFRPVAGGLSVVNSCGQPVVGRGSVVSASPVDSVNGLSIGIVHTAPQAQSTGARRLDGSLS